MASEQVDTANKSLDRIQNFDTSRLPRTSQLGETLSFSDAVDPANKIINLFRQFPIQCLEDLPSNQLGTISNSADSFYQILSQILEFDAKQSNSYDVRTSLIQSLRNQYQSYFDQLQPLISYGSSRQRDFAKLESDFRAAIQRSMDESAELMKALASQQEDAKRILEEVRKVAAEQGVSQQAEYFKVETREHNAESDKWQKLTNIAAGALVFYAVVSAFAHHVPGLTPTSTYEALQLGLSKVLVFAVLAYMLLLFAKNFLNHKHNAIVNRHRQNALLTFNALVEAAGTEERRDVILTYAAACIFSPQETGYTKSANSGSPEMPLSIIQALPKVVGATGQH